jgi:hypothetical protein
VDEALELEAGQAGRGRRSAKKKKKKEEKKAIKAKKSRSANLSIEIVFETMRPCDQRLVGQRDRSRPPP